MAALTLSVEDASSLIHYEPAGAWTNPSTEVDPLARSYSEGSFHSTSQQGATATIQFNGTGINVFAGNRPNYGSFQLKVDGNVVTQGQAGGNSQPEFNKLIASTTGLSNGPHTAVLENTSSAPIDVDKIDVLTELGLPGSVVNTATYDDTDPAITYLPSAGDWKINNAPGFLNNTLHFSNNSQASVSFTWNDGEAFGIWTTAAPDHRNFDLTLDGQQLESCKGGADIVTGLRPSVLMHYQTGLGPGQHTLTMTGSDGGPFVDLDSIKVFSTTGGSSPSSSGLSIGVIAGIAASALVFLLLLLALIYFLLRRAGRLPFRPFRRQGAASDDAQVLPRKDLEAGILDRPDSSTAVGMVVPNSATSSFFTREQDIPDDSSIHSRTPMVPPLPEASFQTDAYVESSSSNGGAAYFTSNAGPHQSMQAAVEVFYPVVK